MTKVIEGYAGGNLTVDESGVVTVFFWERFATGCPCEAHLGRVIDALLALKAGEYLEIEIEGIDEIFAGHAPEEFALENGDIALYILSTYRHPTNMVIVSQEQLRRQTRGDAARV